MIARIVQEILEVHGPALRLFAQRWCESPDDCLQDAVIKVAAQSEVPENWIPWVYRIVKNQAISQRRKSNTRLRHEKQAGVVRPAWFVESEDSRFDSGELREALLSLDENLCEVVVARVWGKLTFEQIASTIECSASTAHQRYASGIQKLRQILEAKETMPKMKRGADSETDKATGPAADSTAGNPANQRPSEARTKNGIRQFLSSVGWPCSNAAARPRDIAAPE